MNKGLEELRHACRESRGLFLAAFLFSVAVNLLLLTGPLYMLQVYDRVLGSRSEETLVAPSLLAAGLFVAMGLLDHCRARLLAIIGARFMNRLDRRVFEAALKRSAIVPDDPAAQAAQRDLDAIQRLLASQALIALFDMPWTSVFLAAIFIFNPALGWVAVAGGAVLVAISFLNQWATQQSQRMAWTAGMSAERLSDQLKSEAELLRALGMMQVGFDRWQKARCEALAEGLRAGATGGVFGTISRTFRMFLQSAMLGAGAWLVLRGEMTGGAMIAGSILMGRALAPIEIAVTQWPVVQRASLARARLAKLLQEAPREPPRTKLPRPAARLRVDNLSVGPPGGDIMAIRAISFELDPGQALGVIGPSGAGKTSLARALTGVWKPTGGAIRLDGAALDQYEPDVLGKLMGYLPQRVALFDGTIAENIARLDADPDSRRVVQAAKLAAAHDMIIRLPSGYDTRVTALGGRLSGGQIQRIGLARALYGDPVMMILDEPNSSLDNEGSQALNTAIRSLKASGKCVIVMAHRAAALQECDLLLVIEDGRRKAFGPRDQVLRHIVRSHMEVVRTASAGGSV